MKWNFYSTARIALPALMLLLLGSISDANAQSGWSFYPDVLSHSLNSPSLTAHSNPYDFQISPVQSGIWNNPHVEVFDEAGGLNFWSNDVQGSFRNSTTNAISGYS